MDFWHIHISVFDLEASVALSHIQCYKLLSVAVALRGSNSINIKLFSSNLEEKIAKDFYLRFKYSHKPDLPDAS